AGRLAENVELLAPTVKRWLEKPTLAEFLELASGLMKKGAGGAAGSAEMLNQGMSFLNSLVEGINRALSGQGRAYHAGSIFKTDKGKSKYFFTSNGRLLIMRIMPAKDFATMDVINRPLRLVREAIEQTRNEYPDVRAGLTGRPVLQADEMDTTNSDMTKASVIAILLVGLVFTVMLHGWLRPVIVMISLIMAIAWTFGFAALTVGRLNLLSIVFVLVLVGIGVDFGVHVVLRYVESCRNGLDVDEAVHSAIFNTGPGVVLGALTSVCAFYSVLGSDFIGLAELGLIGGTGILFCLVTMLAVLPAMLLIAGRKNLFPSSRPRVVAIPVLEKLSMRRKLLLTAVACATAVMLPGLFRTGFNHNLLDLQARGLESVRYERILLEESDESTWFAVMVVDSIAELKRRTDVLRTIPGVGKMESILDYIPGDQARKEELYSKACAMLPPVPDSEEPGRVRRVPDAPTLIRALETLAEGLEGLQEKLFSVGAAEELSRMEHSLDLIDSSLGILGEDMSRAALLAGFERDFRVSMFDLLRKLKIRLSASPVTPGDLPVAFRGIFTGSDGRFQIKISPVEDVWDFEKLTGFVADPRAIDPEVSGVPVGVMESAILLKRAFLKSAALTLAMVSMVLWLYSLSVRYVVLTLLPLGFGILWLVELMGWFGVSFNLANFFAIPVLIAISVDGGVHFMARWQKLSPGQGLFATSTPVAVTLSFLTTMIGFGGLLLAHHRGLASLGVVMVLGSFTGMMACLLILPAVLKPISEKKRL
ncbi:MAG TPA: RND transporter, partial [Thermodesulfobacteriaceae bacterium]|nr:RND transporter [Thermodesulfobacteriaceae bacterium]